MATEGQALTASEYIVHHLGHANASGKAQKGIVDFSLINYDTVFWSTAMAILAGFLLWRAAKAVHAGVPNRFVGAIEALCEFVNDQAKSLIHGDIRYIAPLALTVFVWIVFMNALDLVPVDLVPWLVAWLGIHEYQRIVPTADLNATMAMSLVVITASIYYGIKAKGAGGFSMELLSAPFGTGPSSGPYVIFKPVLMLLNLMMQVIEYVARAVSLAMRLFGNMFAGELIFMLIALLGATMTWWLMGLHFFLGLGWAIFHILIVILQGFIFMMLTLVYLGQAHDAH